MLRTFVVTLLFLGAIGIANAQRWNEKQLEVWKAVEAYWAQDASNDTEGFLSNFSDDYVGWYNESDVPSGKDVTRKFITYGHKGSKTHFYHLEPMGIVVRGDFAVVHYIYMQHESHGDSDPKWSEGRWTDVLEKQKGKWMLIADHGGPDDD